MWAARHRRLVGGASASLLLDAGTPRPRGSWSAPRATRCTAAWAGQNYSTDRLGPGHTTDVDWISSLSLGGLSNYWTGAVPRFAPEDFTRARASTSGSAGRSPTKTSCRSTSWPSAICTSPLASRSPACRPMSGRFHYRLPADWQAIVDAADRRRPRSRACCRWPRAVRGWRCGEARSSTATTASCAPLLLVAPLPSRDGRPCRTD